MTIPNTLLLVLALFLSIPSYAQPRNEWVVVLEDPRPARLQGWQRNDYGSGNQYDHTLALKRVGKKLAKKHALSVSDEWFIGSLGVYCLIVRMDREQKATMDALNADKLVKWVQPSNRFYLLQSPDSKNSNSAFLNPPELRLPQNINGHGTVVALIDSAVDDEHPDIIKGIEKNIDFVDADGKRSRGEEHGTAIASIIVGDRESELGVTGIASGAKLNVFRGCWETSDDAGALGPNCSTLSLALALDAVAKSNSDILNLSLSGPKDKMLDELITKVIAGGTRVVTAFDPNRRADDRFPSTKPGLVTVQAGSLAGSDPDVLSAPGSRVVASPGRRANLMHGHSIATAYTTGVLALCVQIENQLGKNICSQERLERLEERSIDKLISQLEQELKLAQL